MARIVALIYNGRNLYTRLAVPDKHSEAITSRPLLLSGIGRLVKSGHQKKLTLTSMHGEADKPRIWCAKRGFGERYYCF